VPPGASEKHKKAGLEICVITRELTGALSTSNCLVIKAISRTPFQSSEPFFAYRAAAVWEARRVQPMLGPGVPWMLVGSQPWSLAAQDCPPALPEGSIMRDTESRANPLFAGNGH